METQYHQEEVEKLLISHLTNQGFELQVEKALDDRIRWRVPVFAKRGQEELAIDVRLNDSITGFWLTTYRKTCEICPSVKIFVAIPEDIIVPFTLGKKLEENNIGIILVSYDGINYLLESRSPAERRTTAAIRKKLDARINTTQYENLKPYVTEIIDAVNIFEIGCPREAIGTIGRVLETAIDDFLIEANKKHKIALSETKRKSMDFHNKIGFLASKKYSTGKRKPIIITQGEDAKMLSIKWDRNIGDHPANESELQQLIHDSRAMLELGISMISLMKKKRDEL